MRGKRILMVTAVDAEAEAVKAGVQAAINDGYTGQIEIITGGVGPAAAAATTAMQLCRASYDVVISMGIAGGFAGRAPIGHIVVAERFIAADLGAESPDGFISVDDLGFGQSCLPADKGLIERLRIAFEESELDVSFGDILTASTVTGSVETAQALQARYPDAVAEAMEGYGAGIAAQLAGVPIIEVRAISNAVGPRDRAAWRIGDALQALTQASKVITEVLK